MREVIDWQGVCVKGQKSTYNAFWREELTYPSVQRKIWAARVTALQARLRLIPRLGPLALRPPPLDLGHGSYPRGQKIWADGTWQLASDALQVSPFVQLWERHGDWNLGMRRARFPCLVAFWRVVRK